MTDRKITRGVELVIALTGCDLRLAEHRLGREVTAMAQMHLPAPTADELDVMLRDLTRQAREEITVRVIAMEAELWEDGR